MFMILLGYLLIPLGVTAFTLEARDSPLCLSESCVTTAADLLRQMDRNICPCQDFYKFACGGFIANTVLPEYKTRSGFSLIYSYTWFILILLMAFLMTNCRSD